MATIAIGDVHGNFAALDDLLLILRPELGPSDVVVFLGDYIDRGPDTRNCIERILTLDAECTAEVVGLCGNHDDWLLRSRRDFRTHTWALATDVFETIRSYSPDAADALRLAMAEARGAIYGDDCALPVQPVLRLHARVTSSDGSTVCDSAIALRTASVRMAVSTLKSPTSRSRRAMT